MSTEQAIDYLSRARRILDHVGTKTKTEQLAAKSIRELIDAAKHELTAAPLPPIEVPAGARQGISGEPRSDWRRR